MVQAKMVCPILRFVCTIAIENCGESKNLCLCIFQTNLNLSEEASGQNMSPSCYCNIFLPWHLKNFGLQRQFSFHFISWIKYFVFRRTEHLQYLNCSETLIVWWPFSNCVHVSILVNIYPGVCRTWNICSTKISTRTKWII